MLILLVKVFTLDFKKCTGGKFLYVEFLFCCVVCYSLSISRLQLLEAPLQLKRKIEMVSLFPKKFLWRATKSCPIWFMDVYCCTRTAATACTTNMMFLSLLGVLDLI